MAILILIKLSLFRIHIACASGGVKIIICPTGQENLKSFSWAWRREINITLRTVLKSNAWGCSDWMVCHWEGVTQAGEMHVLSRGMFYLYSLSSQVLPCCPFLSFWKQSLLPSCPKKARRVSQARLMIIVICHSAPIKVLHWSWEDTKLLFVCLFFSLVPKLERMCSEQLVNTDSSCNLPSQLHPKVALSKNKAKTEESRNERWGETYAAALVSQVYC